jgi:hypothetical protein
MAPYESSSPEVRAISALQRETPTAWGNTRHDAFTFRFAMDYLKRAHPRVLYIAFDETDDWRTRPTTARDAAPDNGI